MSLGPRPVHIVSTDFDYASQPEFDRIGYIFEDRGYTASKVYILTNNNLKGVDTERIEEEALEGIIEKLAEVTSADPDDDLIPVEVDYYDFEEALITAYEIIYKEEKRGNNVFVNISGGTKPLAIAVSFACALAGIDQDPFYVVKEYKMDNETITSPGIEGISELDVFNLEETIPVDERQQDLLLRLLESDTDSIGITELLVKNEIVAPSSSQDDDNNRRNMIQSYHRKAQSLNDENLVTQENDSSYSLTSTGRLIAKILRARNGVDKKAD